MRALKKERDVRDSEVDTEAEVVLVCDLTSGLVNQSQHSY
jgi:hypothetical protein